MTSPRPSSTDAEFRAWLTQECAISPKPVRDLVSRLRRVRRYIDEQRIANEPHAWAYLIYHTDLSDCSTTVRSQLKQALLIYQRFLLAKERAVLRATAEPTSSVMTNVNGASRS